MSKQRWRYRVRLARIGAMRKAGLYRSWAGLFYQWGLRATARHYFSMAAMWDDRSHRIGTRYYYRIEA